MSTSSTPGSAALLRRQLKQMQTDKDIPGISCGLVNDNNIYEWEVMLMINDETKYYGGTVPPALVPALPPFIPQDKIHGTQPADMPRLPPSQEQISAPA